MTPRVPPAESLLNADGEVAVFVPPLGARPLSWRDAGRGMVEFALAGGGATAFGVAPGHLAAALAKGRVLLVEAGADGASLAESWVAGPAAVQRAAPSWAPPRASTIP